MNKKNVGCIVGRFQFPELTDSHKDLYQKVFDNHHQVVFMVCSQGRKNPDSGNPLDFPMREQMLREAYPSDQFPNVTIMSFKDKRYNEEWSEELDSVLMNAYPIDNFVLYGRKDSFVNLYTGRWLPQVLEPDNAELNGQSQRDEASANYVSSADFRRGVIWANTNRMPIVYPTVDIAVVQQLTNGYYNILLGKKKHEPKWRLIGGFAERKEPYEHSSYRELLEEAGLQLNPGQYPLHYIGSVPIDDYRYQDKDSITTTLFGVMLGLEAPPIKAGDDIYQVGWWSGGGMHDWDDIVMPEHVPLIYMVEDWVSQQLGIV